MQACEHIDGPSLCQEVENHLMCYFARISADSLRGDAMVGGEDINGFADRFGELFLANGHHLCREVFQSSQAADRLGERVEMQASLLPPDFTGWCDIANQVLD